MNLMEFFREHGKVALGFSGGVDSSYLLYIAKRLGARVLPVFVKTPFQPAFELEDARKVAETVGVELTV
ncbi:MAG: 7-cyano-7-deazaguanine synthase, partial [Firmicutes bacterium]|nr:7-cyano-7-deazaguanine synthase [Bacillota bacterium]